jgi:hypothetical protein
MGTQDLAIDEKAAELGKALALTVYAMQPEDGEIQQEDLHVIGQTFRDETVVLMAHGANRIDAWLRPEIEKLGLGESREMGHSLVLSRDGQHPQGVLTVIAGEAEGMRIVWSEQNNEAGRRAVVLTLLRPDGDDMATEAFFMTHPAIREGRIPVTSAHPLMRPMDAYALFCSAVLPAIPETVTAVRDRTTASRSNWRIEDMQGLLDHDGGLPGAAWLAFSRALDVRLIAMQADWAARALPELVKRFAAKDVVWGSSYLKYNDGDNRTAALLTSDPGVAAVFHQNVSTIRDRNSFIAWLTADEDAPQRLCLLSVNPRATKVSELVSKFMDDPAAVVPTLSFDYRSRAMTIGGGVDYLMRPADPTEAVDRSGLIESFAFYLDSHLREMTKRRWKNSDTRLETGFVDLDLGDHDEEYAPPTP